MNETKYETSGSQLTVTRMLNAPLDLVWRAWTEQELLDQWWAPSPWKSKTKSMDFREGGQRHYAMCGPQGEEYWAITTYKSIQPKTEFSGEDAFTDDQGTINEEFPVARFQNHFKDYIESTEVTITTHYASEQHLQQVIDMGMTEGLSMAFENLDQVLHAINE